MILVISGIFFPIYHFKKMNSLKVEYQTLQDENKRLSYAQDVNQKKIINLQTEVYTKDITIKERESTIKSLKEDINKIHSDYENKIKELQDITLEQAIQIIIDYYGYTTADIEIIEYENEIRVICKPFIAHDWVNTLTKLESRDMEVIAYQNQVIEYDSLMCDYIDKINLIEQERDLQLANYELEREKNSNFQKIIDARNKKIQSIKLQRNVIGGVAVVVIVLALI